MATAASASHISERSREPLSATPTIRPHTSASKAPREYVRPTAISISSTADSAASRSLGARVLSAVRASPIGTPKAIKRPSAFQYPSGSWSRGPNCVWLRLNRPGTRTPGRSFCPNAYTVTASTTSSAAFARTSIERRCDAPTTSARPNTSTYVSARLSSSHVWSGAMLHRTLAPLQRTNAASDSSPATAVGRAEKRSAPLHIQATAAATAITDTAVCTRAWAATPIAPWSKAVYKRRSESAPTSTVTALWDVSSTSRAPGRTNVPGRAISTVDIGWRS